MASASKYAPAGDYAFRVIPKAFSSLVRLMDLTFIDCGVHGFESGFEALTALRCLAVVFCTLHLRHYCIDVENGEADRRAFQAHCSIGLRLDLCTALSEYCTP